MNKEEKEVEVVVVAIDNLSLKYLNEKKFYAFPKGSRKIGKYFAFYKSGEIFAYAEVKKLKEVGKSELGSYWIYCFPDAEPPFQKVTFDKIIKLKVPIKKDNLGRGKGHIQGRIYTTFRQLLAAKTIADLA